MKVLLVIVLLVILASAAYAAQARGRSSRAAKLPSESLVPPTHGDVAYGKDPDGPEKMDVFLAKSDKPTPALVYIHGGGWSGGNKLDDICYTLVDMMRPLGVSVITVEYAFAPKATHPTQVNDCDRAIQFIRHHAKEWNIDPKRIGVTGGSAGGHLSLWVGLHGDAAKPGSADPVERESSRVACVINCAGPSDFRLIRTIEHIHPAYRSVLGIKAETPADEIPLDRLESISPAAFVTPDDPPVLSYYGDVDEIVPLEHAEVLHKALDKAGVENRLIVAEGHRHSISGAPKIDFREGIAFIKRHLLGERPASAPAAKSSRIKVKLAPPEPPRGAR